MYVESKRGGRTLVAVILGMSVREAARMGMIDESILRPRTKTVHGVSTPEDNELFVSDKDNQLPAPVVEMVSPPLDGETRDSDSSASGIRNPFQRPHPPAAVNPFAKPQPTMPAAEHPPETLQSPQPPNPFASMFSNAATPSTTPAPAAPAPSPFATSMAKTQSTSTPSTSSFSFPTTTTAPKEKASGAAMFATKSPSIFPPSGSSVTPPLDSTAQPNPFAASAASFTANKPFMAGTKEETPTVTSGQASSLFSGSSFTSSTPSPFAAKPNPFAASLSTFAPPKITDASQVPDSQALSSLVPTANPFFPSAAVSASQAEEKTSSVTATSAQTQPPPFTGFTQGASFAHKPPAPEQTMIEGTLSTPSASMPEKPVPVPNFFGPSTTTSSEPQPSKFKFPTANATTKPPIQTQVAEAQSVETSLSAQPTQPETTTPAGSPELVPDEVEEKVIEPPEPPVEPVPVARTSISAPIYQPVSTKGTKAPPFDPYKTPEERKAAWERFIQRRKKEVIEQEQAKSRKRALEAPAAVDSAQEEPGPKVAKVSEEPSPPPKYSLVKSYLDSLPKLPCLERTRELLERRQPTEEEAEAAKPPNRQVDEDELLLNAARIAAEQLRTGPKIFDSLATYREPRRSSYSPRTSLGTPTPYTQSASPPPHGYQVAYAPDTPLGLGRTMSRTEQRIRATGGHGLAYKPLDFSRKSERKDQRDGFTRSG